MTAGGSSPLLRQRAAERGCELVVADPGRDRPVGQRRPVGDCELGGATEQVGRAGVRDRRSSALGVGERFDGHVALTPR